MARPNHLSVLIWYGGNFWLTNWNNKLQRTLTQEFMHMFRWLYLNFNLNQILLRRNSFKRATLSQKISIFLWSRAGGRWKMFSHETIDNIVNIFLFCLCISIHVEWKLSLHDWYIIFHRISTIQITNIVFTKASHRDQTEDIVGIWMVASRSNLKLLKLL